MKRNYLLIYQSKYTGEILRRYFETIEDMKDFIKMKLSQHKYWKVLHKYEIKEMN